MQESPKLSNLKNKIFVLTNPKIQTEQMHHLNIFFDPK